MPKKLQGVKVFILQDKVKATHKNRPKRDKEEDWERSTPTLP